MRVKGNQTTTTSTSRPFSRDFINHGRIPSSCYSTTVYLIPPPPSLPHERPWFFATTTSAPYPTHPLAGNPQPWYLPKHFDFLNLPHSILVSAVHSSPSFDKLLIILPPYSYSKISKNRDWWDCTLLALTCGGQLRGCPPYTGRGGDNSPSPWVTLRYGSASSRSGGVEKFDDIVYHKSKVFALDRQGRLYLVNNDRNMRKVSLGQALINTPIDAGTGQFGWRKRFVVDATTSRQLYAVVRTSEILFQVYKLIERGSMVYCWERVWGFDGGLVLFIGRDYHYFWQVKWNFPGWQHKNCIVFSEGAFPKYGNGCWELSESCNDDDIGVFRLPDNTFAREGEISKFPRILWSPPPWILRASEIQANAPLKRRRVLISRESEENEEMQSNSKDHDPKLIEFDSDSGNEIQDGKVPHNSDVEDEEDGKVQSVSNNQGGEDGKGQCFSRNEHEDGKVQSDSNNQLEEGAEMRSYSNIEDGLVFQGDVSPSLLGPETVITDAMTASLSAAEEEVTRTLLSMNGGNYSTEEETSRKNITLLIPRDCSSSTTTTTTTTSLPQCLKGSRS